MCLKKGAYGCAVPQGVWHTVVVLEPSVIYEGKDKKYGENGTETWVNGEWRMNPSVSKLTAPLNKGAANGEGLILLRNNSVATRHS